MRKIAGRMMLIADIADDTICDSILLTARRAVLTDEAKAEASRLG